MGVGSNAQTLVARVGVIVPLLGFVHGCSSEQPIGSVFGGSGTESGAADSGDAGDATGTSGSSADGIRYDVAGGTGGGGCNPDAGDACGCTKVDLLFVVDNSLSMQRNQELLRDAFPSMVDAMFDSLPPATSLHVGVTTTEMGYTGSGGSSTNCVTTPQPSDGTIWDVYLTPEEGDSGRPDGQGRLRVIDGKAFYAIDTDADAATRQAFESWFGQAVVAGESGSNIEMSSAAAAWAGHPANAGTNAGFLRDAGAVFAVVFLQDEHDQTPEDAVNLLAMLEQQKQACGGLDCIVGGGFINTMCAPETPIGAMLDAFSDSVIDQLPFGGFGGTADLDGLLSDLLTNVIAQKCDEIPPEG